MYVIENFEPLSFCWQQERFTFIPPWSLEEPPAVKKVITAEKNQTEYLDLGF
jgi:hypothetical protein